MNICQTNGLKVCFNTCVQIFMETNKGLFMSGVCLLISNVGTAGFQTYSYIGYYTHYL